MSQHFQFRLKSDVIISVGVGHRKNEIFVIVYDLLGIKVYKNKLAQQSEKMLRVLTSLALISPKNQLHGTCRSINGSRVIHQYYSTSSSSSPLLSASELKADAASVQLYDCRPWESIVAHGKIPNATWLPWAATGFKVHIISFLITINKSNIIERNVNAPSSNHGNMDFPNIVA